MKLISTILLIISFGILQSVKAQTSKTVLDYYLEVPEGGFMCDMQGIIKDGKDYRISKIVRMDTRNGYLLAYNDYLWIQVAQFTYWGKNIIAVSIICGMGCMCNSEEFYEIQSNGKWKDVTADIFPKELKDAGWIILPETGTTVQIYDYDLLDQYNFKPMTDAQKKALRYELIWEKGKFVEKK